MSNAEYDKNDSVVKKSTRFFYDIYLIEV